MKNICIFGAAGLTGRCIVNELEKDNELKLTLFVRNPDKLDGQVRNRHQVVVGDALNKDDVRKALDNQDVLVCSLEGDVLTMAHNIVDSLEYTSVKQIIWITGMGIHGEIKGARGVMLKMLAKQRPEYVEAADLIYSCHINSTLLRCPMIQDGDHTEYELTDEHHQPANLPVDRSAIAQCIADLIADNNLGRNKSLGITNKE